MCDAGGTTCDALFAWWYVGAGPLCPPPIGPGNCPAGGSPELVMPGMVPGKGGRFGGGTLNAPAFPTMEGRPGCRKLPLGSELPNPIKGLRLILLEGVVPPSVEKSGELRAESKSEVICCAPLSCWGGSGGGCKLGRYPANVGGGTTPGGPGGITVLAGGRRNPGSSCEPYMPCIRGTGIPTGIECGADFDWVTATAGAVPALGGKGG
mmetsp:Transcript_20366/g.44412  ORF Transcript_20366/g.44412 Transcript_20366/m.44412 type:complete len:208 (+) Transcript_20366:134-757(+)